MDYLRLDEVCNLNMGQSPSSDSYNQEGKGIPFFQGNADFGELYPITRVWCDEPTKIVDKGTLLISVRAPIGALNFATEKSCIGRGLAGLTVKAGYDLKYIYYVLKFKEQELNNKGTGSTFKAISKSSLGEVLVPDISIGKQKDYVKKLDLIQRMLVDEKKQMVQLDMLIKSRFVEMFGNPETNSKGWDECELSEKLNVLGGYAFKSDMFDEEDGIPVLRIGNINAGYFKPVNVVFWKNDSSLERYAMYPGDLVMSLTGTVGKDDYGNVCILGNDYDMYYLNQRNAKLEIKEGIDKYYLLQLLKFEQIKKKLTGISRGVRQANILNRDILNLVVPLPPIELQNQFAAFVRQVDKLKVAAQETLNETQKLFNSLMQQYFG